MEKKIQIDARTALVLEGGGMRGVFTCGVLDSFMDRGIRFPRGERRGLQRPVLHVGAAREGPLQQH